jgi:hypothetical protein
MAKNKQELQELHTIAMKRYEASFAAENDQRQKVLEDMRFVFVPGSQWDDKETKARRNRPRFEINKIAVPVNQAIGDQRQNRISVKVRAAKGQASKEIADVLSGLIRNIETASHFKDIKDIAFKEMVSGGMGAWCVTTGYADDQSFDQEIFLKSIRSAASSVYYDPSSTDELKRDANWIMVTEDIDKETFKARWPDATAGNLSAPGSNSAQAWQTRDTVRIADYWTKVPCVVEIALMSDGKVIELTKESKMVLDELAEQGITVLKTRKKPTHKIVMYKISGSEILDGPKDWAGQYIPVVPIFGYNIWINGQHYYQGMVRAARDPQRVYNYATSQMIETSALSPKDPIWATAKQMKGHELQMANYNVSNTPFMLYNHDPDAPGAPQRTGAPALQTALVQQVQQADMDVQSTTGQFQPSIGDVQPGQSGRAILALQRQGNASTHELNDNLTKAVEYTSQILIDLIPRIYDTERQISILGDDGASGSIVINQTVRDETTGKDVIITDLSLGKYDVVSTAGPSYATQRTEGLNFLTKLAETSPIFATIATDLMASSVDFPFAEELTHRIRKTMIANGTIEPNQEEAEQLSRTAPQPSAVDQLNFKMLQLQVEQQAAIVDNLALQNEKIKADTIHKYAETQETLTDTIETKVNINTKLDKQGNPINMPIETGELSARAKNMAMINDAMEMTLKDAAQLEYEKRLPQQSQIPEMGAPEVPLPGPIVPGEEIE